MNLLHQILSSPIIQRLGWTLLHSLWEGAAIAALLLIALLTMRGSTSRLRYLACCAAMIGLALSPVMTYLIILPSRPDSQPLASAADVPLVQAPALKPALPPMTHLAIARERLPLENPLTHAGTAPGLLRNVEPEATPARPFHVLLRERAAAALAPLLPWLVLMWAIGVLCLSLWNAGGWVAVQQLKSISTRPAGPDLEHAAARIAKLLGLRRPVRLLESALAHTPMVVGALRPVVLLPACALTGLTPAELESLLAHELAHVLRHDYLVNLLQTAIETLLFYHPAIWWVSHRIRIERENSCDDLAVAITQDRTVYVRALATLSGAQSPDLALAASDAALVARIRRLVGSPTSNTSRGPRWLGGALALAIGGAAVGIAIAGSAQGHARRTLADKAAPAGFLDLRVIDRETKAPLAGAPVMVFERESIIPTSHATTGADGECRIKLPAENTGFFAVAASPEGYVPERMDWRTDKWGRLGEAPPAHFTLDLDRGHRIGGIVQDEQGKPIAGATVYVTLLPASYQRHVFVWLAPEKTGPDGQWECDRAPAKDLGVMSRAFHPDYASGETYVTTSGQPGPTTAEFVNRTAVLVLKKGLPLAGTVVDENSHAIAGAAVGLFPVYNFQDDPHATSDAQGRFRFAHVRPGNITVVARTPDHGAQSKDVAVTSDMLPVDFRLGRGRTIRGRVVDQDHQPLAGAELSEGHYSWNSVTGPDGTFVWKSAPVDAVTLYATKPGFSRADERVAAGDETERQIVLGGPQRVSGIVVDADTNAPIQSFKLIPGGLNSGSEGIRFARQSAGTFTGGRFQIQFYDRLAARFLRAEADGYLPAMSRAIQDSENSARIELRLKRGAGIGGVVLNKDGQPLAGADVLLATPTQHVDLDDGIPIPERSIQTTSGSDGRFSLPGQYETWKLIAVHDQGYAEVTEAQFARSPQIRLGQWGRVEGVARTGGKAAADDRVALENHDPYSLDKPQINYWANKRPTDEKGAFAFERVRPGKWIARRELAGHRGHEQNVPIEVKPGQTTRITLGGKGRRIVGRVIEPGGPKRAPFLYLGCELQLLAPPLPLPPGWDQAMDHERFKAVDDWWKSPLAAGFDQLQMRATKYPIQFDADLAFHVDDVPPGIYAASVSAFSGEPHEPGRDVAGRAERIFLVPPIAGAADDKPVEIGGMPLDMVKLLGVGEIAPNFEVRTLDGKPLKLSDYKGKYVLLDFWATWCGPCMGTMRDLKEIYQRFGKDNRLVVISLSVDEKPDEVRKFVEKNDMKWTQVFLGGWSQAPITADYRLQWIPSVFLIGPDGKIISEESVGPALRESVAKALAR